MTDNIKDIPRNPNSIENGMTDPQPEKGKGGFWRALVSWCKGWAPEKDK